MENERDFPTLSLAFSHFSRGLSRPIINRVDRRRWREKRFLGRSRVFREVTATRDAVTARTLPRRPSCFFLAKV